MAKKKSSDGDDPSKKKLDGKRANKSTQDYEMRYDKKHPDNNKTITKIKKKLTGKK